MRRYILLLSSCVILSCSRAETPAGDSGSATSPAATVSAATATAQQSPNNLTRDSAKAIIATTAGYPKTITGSVFMSNAMGKGPFTEADVAPYLIRYKQDAMQNKSALVRACEIDILEVTGIATASDGHSADVDYSTEVHATPFSVRTGNVIPDGRCEGGRLQAQFKLYDDGWRMVRQ